MNLSEHSRITAIEPQARHKGRMNIFIDGEFAIGLAEAVVAGLHLKVGQAVTTERLREASAAEERHQATEAAYRLLSFRARSGKELSDRLRQKGYEGAVIDEVIARLSELGYLDDAAFASSWVSSRGTTRGSRLLSQELRLKGVDRETAAETIREARDEETEAATALSVAIRRVGERPNDRTREAQAKLAAFLQRRGFGWDAIRPVLRRLYRSSAADEEGEDEANDLSEIAEERGD
ncbi:MAG: RecX family transcriptional regulator [Capsulimonadales bacterium]|nr:RecX family transcriptional regulator [Capsulimonadales bacterium]